jgi:hypothetical protein
MMDLADHGIKTPAAGVAAGAQERCVSPRRVNRAGGGSAGNSASRSASVRIAARYDLIAVRHFTPRGC